ncbi:MAG: amidohydrolase family protein [Planctomycetota bacterium]
MSRFGIRTPASSNLLLLTSLVVGLILSTSDLSRCDAKDNELGSWSSSSGSAVTTVYMADRLFTGTDKGTIESAALVVRDGKVIEVTTQNKVRVQAGWKVVSLKGSTLMPGMVIAETGLIGSGEEERTLSPEIRAIDGFDFFGDYDSLLASGITTVQISAGRNRLMPGQTAVVKLAGEDPISRTVSEVESLRIQLTQAAFDAPTIYEPPVAAVSVDRPLVATRFQVARDLPAALLTIQALWKATAPAADEDSDDSIIIDSIRPFVGEKTVRVTARSASEVLATVDLMENLDQPFVLVAPARVDPVVDKLVASKQLRGIVLEHDLRPGSWTNLPDPESKASTAKSVSERWLSLRERLPKLPIALMPVSDGDLADIRFLVAVLAGSDSAADAAAALTTVTGDAAALLGVQDRVGSLEPGKDADFVVLSGMPLDPQSRVLATYVNGSEAFGSSVKESSMLLSGATVVLPDGSEAEQDIAVSGRSIRAVGSSVSAAPQGRKYRLDGCYITPGFIDAGTKLGAGQVITNRVSTGDKLGKYLVPDDDAVRRGRMGGVVIGLLSSDSLPSPVVAFKLSDQPRVLKDPVAIRSRLSGNPTTAEASLKKTLASAKSYSDAWNAYDKKLAEYKVALAKYEEEKKKYDAAVAKKKKEEEEAKKKAEAEKAKSSSTSSSSSKPSEQKTESKGTPPKEEKKEGESSSSSATAKPAAKPSGSAKPEDKSSELKAPTKPAAPKAPSKSSTLEPYRSVFKKEIPLIIEVSEESGVETALNLVVDEFKLNLVLAASGTAYLAADKIAEKNVPVRWVQR